MLYCANTPHITAKFFRCRVCSPKGASLAPVCAHCGRDFPETARFCAWCGEPRKPEAARIAEVPGERKRATVLFADVTGSTATIAGMDAEAAMNFCIRS
jgi:predicted amidophosphoribosyltransferase